MGLHNVFQQFNICHGRNLLGGLNGLFLRSSPQRWSSRVANCLVSCSVVIKAKDSQSLWVVSLLHFRTQALPTPSSLSPQLSERRGLWGWEGFQRRFNVMVPDVWFEIGPHGWGGGGVWSLWLLSAISLAVCCLAAVLLWGVRRYVRGLPRAGAAGSQLRTRPRPAVWRHCWRSQTDSG